MVRKIICISDTHTKYRLLKVPKLHVFGHIHEGYGLTKKENIIFVNASVVNENYDIVNKPIEVNL